MSEIDAYPLTWPQGWPRHRGPRERGTFQGTPAAVREQLIDEIDRMLNSARGYTFRPSIIISSNLPLRRDGMPIANAREPLDPGIAVYFKRDGKTVCFACDKFDRTWKNMRAISKTIEALRGIDRWGSSEMLDRAFTGFAALPAPGAVKPWHEVLDIPAHTPTAEVKARYRELAKRRHPDAGGSNEAFAELGTAWHDFQKERGLS